MALLSPMPGIYSLVRCRSLANERASRRGRVLIGSHVRTNRRLGLLSLLLVLARAGWLATNVMVWLLVAGLVVLVVDLRSRLDCDLALTLVLIRAVFGVVGLSVVGRVARVSRLVTGLAGDVLWTVGLSAGTCF